MRERRGRERGREGRERWRKDDGPPRRRVAAFAVQKTSVPQPLPQNALRAPERRRYVLLRDAFEREPLAISTPRLSYVTRGAASAIQSPPRIFHVITRLERRESRLTATFPLGASHLGDIAQLVVLFSYTYNIPIYRVALRSGEK